jgi:hypothetical protein
VRRSTNQEERPEQKPALMRLDLGLSAFRTVRKLIAADLSNAACGILLRQSEKTSIGLKSVFIHMLIEGIWKKQTKESRKGVITHETRSWWRQEVMEPGTKVEMLLCNLSPYPSRRNDSSSQGKPSTGA